MKSTYLKFKTYLFLFFLAITLSNCTTPARLGNISLSNNYNSRPVNNASNSNIKVEIGPISSEDDYAALAIVKDNITSLISNNYSYNSIRSKYPDARVVVDIDLSETKKRTWLLDIPFYYPLTGVWPLSPWWGDAKLKSTIHFDIPNGGRASFDFLISENYTIIFYPYYRAKKIITEKYQIGWDELSHQLSDFDFVTNWTGSQDIFKELNNSYSAQKQSGNNSNNERNSTQGDKPNVPIEDKKKIEPPILDFVAGSLQFKDADGNNAISANEKCSIEFQLQNTGKGDGVNLKALVKGVGSNSGITISPSTSLIVCGKGKTVGYSIPISSNMNTVDGKIEISIEIDEPNGFNPPVVKIEIDTKKFVAPAVTVVDDVVFSNNGSTVLELRKPFALQLLIQNTGQGVAKDVTVKLPVPENVFMQSGEEITSIGTLDPGETRSIEYEFILNAKFIGATLILNADLTESTGKYATDWKRSFALNQALAAEKMIVTSKREEGVNIEVASLRSDVDKDIPLGIPQNKKKYALIIGNEDYSKYQTTLDKEVNVDFAANDARVFAEYCEKTLGYPKDNIMIVVDGTRGQMSQKLAQLIRFAEVENGQAELLFYYSGHGLPEEATNIPYLIPVDVSGTQPSEGIALTAVYDELSKYPTRKTTVILDACFSGGARNKELVSMKGVKVKAKVDAVPGNLVVLASSSGSEASAVYREKQHGYFTYFLLKNLQTNKGQGKMEAVITEVSQNVAREAARVGKNQTPNVLPGAEIGDGWKILGW